MKFESGEMSIKDQLKEKGFYLIDYGVYQVTADAITHLRETDFISASVAVDYFTQLTNEINCKKLEIKNYGLNSVENYVIKEIYDGLYSDGLFYFDNFDTGQHYGSEHLWAALYKLQELDLIGDVRACEFHSSVFELTEEGSLYCQNLLGELR